MIFWIIVLVMLVGAVLCVLIPLSRKSSDSTGVEAVSLYKAQLAQIDASDMSGEAERAEIGRRLLRESRKASSYRVKAGPSKHATLFASVIALVFIPAASIGLYWNYGSPNASGSPVVAQQSTSSENTSVAEMVKIAEQHLEKNPDDAKGWQVLADVYGQTNRYKDRSMALEQIIRIEGNTPTRQVNLAEALIFSEQNRITPKAKKLLTSALAAEPENLRANVYFAIALEQEGQALPAVKIWQKLSKKRKGDTDWQSMVASRISQLNGKTVKDAADEIANLSKVQQSQMIKGMVDGLAERLKDDPDDLQGWLRLMRSYVVLGKQQDAKLALQTAQGHFAENPTALRELASLASDLKLQSLESTRQED